MRHLTNLIHVLIFLFSPFPLLLHTNRYIYKLAGLHESDGNFAEAGLTLMLHAKTLQVREGEREKERLGVNVSKREGERERLFINIYFSGHWILSQLLRASIQFTLQEKGKRYYTLKQSDYWIKER